MRHPPANPGSVGRTADGLLACFRCTSEAHYAHGGTLRIRGAPVLSVRACLECGEPSELTPQEAHRLRHPWLWQWNGEAWDYLGRDSMLWESH